jgi:hypothetical protein
MLLPFEMSRYIRFLKIEPAHGLLNVWQLCERDKSM